VEITELYKNISGLATWNHAEKIKLFAWHLHAHREKESFTAGEISLCYESLHLAPPSSVSPFISAMLDRKPPQALRTVSGYKLVRELRDAFDEKYGQRQTTIAVHKLLADLPSQIPSIDKRNYLEEAIVCFRSGAFRAAIVMTWNLAFDHLCEFVFSRHLADFNTQLPKTYPKADISAVGKRDDFSVLKESQVIQVCKSSTIISNSIHKILLEKLDRRNIAAHPSGVTMSQFTAEEFIKDLIENVVLKLV
jgi:hypothetical protein